MYVKTCGLTGAFLLDKEMASSDDEGENIMNDVSEYHFVDEKDEPVSFTELPIVWGIEEASGGEVREIFLRGYTDNRGLSVYKKVKAWKLDISLPKPEISVLSSENEWTKLVQPRKSYLELIRTVYITVHFLHLLKKIPDISSKALWDKLSKRFSFEEKPSENDLVDHISLIGETVKRDDSLKDSNVLITFLKNPRKKRILDEGVGTSKKASFIVDDDMVDGTDMNGDNQEESDDEEDDGFDYVCALCDNGGDILCCEGRCLRSFHATYEAGDESNCKSLGLSDETVKRLQIFLCNNCKYNQHQCYACGKLGSSDKSAGAEVFRCVIATCGHFYHPHCVAKLLSPRNDSKEKELREKISTGEQFACPIHECYVCKEGENKNESDLQFAVCRRCPKSYHRKCLPREIAFDEDEELMTRAWEGLLPNGRILIYCLDHEIDEDLCTPPRNHIIFPGLDAKKKRVSSISGGFRTALSSEYASNKSTLLKKPKVVEKLSTSEKQGDSAKKVERRLSVQSSTGHRKAVDTTRKSLKKPSSEKYKKHVAPEGGPSLGDRLYSLMSQSLDLDELNHVGELEQTQHDEFVLEESDSSMDLDADAKERILSIIEVTESKVTMEEIEKNCKIPGKSVYSSKAMDKSITLGKVEAFIEAINAAQQKLDNGGSVENAKSICEPRLLNQIVRWKEKLKVYLAPFLYGLRYTSFGRHFTNVDKLKAIVDRLHWYVQDGDTIVDFCCGSNDFSLILKQKLDEMGKRRCSFKNFDIHPPKNDFSFEKKDWMTVQLSELPPGKNLIMGLNPPFGVNAHLANKFINKALQFKPKLLILIVPRETDRLDRERMNYPYNLIFEDVELLSGKSFYLPGSIDVNGKQMEDWNVSAPPLYLWSHPDWTSTHKSIAEQRGHLKEMLEKADFNKNLEGMTEPNPPAERSGKSSISVDDQCLPSEPEQPLEQRATGTVKGDSSGTENAQKNGSEKSKMHSKEGEHETKLEEKQVKESSAEKLSDSHHSVNSSKRLKASNKELQKGKSSNPKNNSDSGSRSQSRARYGNDEDDRRSKSKDPEDPVRRFSGNTYNKRKGYMRNEDPTTGGSQERDPRENMNIEDPSIGGNNWAHASSPGLSPDYSFRSQHDQYLARQRESSNIMGYQPFPGVSESYRRDEGFLYGLPDPGYANQRMNHYLGGNRPVHAPPYSPLGPPVSLSHNHTSAMQRYAPRLDELNHTRPNEPYVLHDPRRAPPGPRGFAPGPYSSYPTYGSSGWLNE